MTPRYAGPVSSVAARSRVRRRNSGTRKPAAGVGPGTFTLYSTSAQTGYIESNDLSGDYPVAAEGSGNLIANPGSTLWVGQFADFSEGAVYSVQQSFISFDLSAVGGTGCSAAALSLGLGTDNSDDDFDIYVYVYDWGATLTTADFRDPNGPPMDTHSPVAVTYSWMFGAPGGYHAFSEEGSDLRAAVIAAIGGTLRLVLVSSQQVNAVPPGGNEYVLFDTYNGTNPPKLVVTTI